MNWEVGVDIHTILCVKQMTIEPIVQHRKLCSVLCGALKGKEIQKGGIMCIPMGHSLCCTAENNTML